MKQKNIFLILLSITFCSFFTPVYPYIEGAYDILIVSNVGDAQANEIPQIREVDPIPTNYKKLIEEIHTKKENVIIWQGEYKYLANYSLTGFKLIILDQLEVIDPVDYVNLNNVLLLPKNSGTIIIGIATKNEAMEHLLPNVNVVENNADVLDAIGSNYPNISKLNLESKNCYPIHQKLDQKKIVFKNYDEQYNDDLPFISNLHNFKNNTNFQEWYVKIASQNTSSQNTFSKEIKVKIYDKEYTLKCDENSVTLDGQQIEIGPLGNRSITDIKTYTYENYFYMIINLGDIFRVVQLKIDKNNSKNPITEYGFIELAGSPGKYAAGFTPVPTGEIFHMMFVPAYIENKGYTIYPIWLGTENDNVPEIDDIDGRIIASLGTGYDIPSEKLKAAITLEEKKDKDDTQEKTEQVISVEYLYNTGMSNEGAELDKGFFEVPFKMEDFIQNDTSEKNKKEYLAECSYGKDVLTADLLERYKIKEINCSSIHVLGDACLMEPYKFYTKHINLIGNITLTPNGNILVVSKHENPDNPEIDSKFTDYSGHVSCFKFIPTSMEDAFAKRVKQSTLHIDWTYTIYSQFNVEDSENKISLEHLEENRGTLFSNGTNLSKDLNVIPNLVVYNSPEREWIGVRLENDSVQLENDSVLWMDSMVDKPEISTEWLYKNYKRANSTIKDRKLIASGTRITQPDYLNSREYYKTFPSLLKPGNIFNINANNTANPFRISRSVPITISSMGKGKKFIDLAREYIVDDSSIPLTPAGIGSKFSPLSYVATNSGDRSTLQRIGKLENDYYIAEKRTIASIRTLKIQSCSERRISHGTDIIYCRETSLDTVNNCSTCAGDGGIIINNKFFTEIKFNSDNSDYHSWRDNIPVEFNREWKYPAIIKGFTLDSELKYIVYDRGWNRFFIVDENCNLLWCTRYIPDVISFDSVETSDKLLTLYFIQKINNRSILLTLDVKHNKLSDSFVENTDSKNMQTISLYGEQNKLIVTENGLYYNNVRVDLNYTDYKDYKVYDAKFLGEYGIILKLFNSKTNNQKLIYAEGVDNSGLTNPQWIDIENCDSFLDVGFAG